MDPRIRLEDLRQILKAHQEWLQSGKTSGERANLSATDLQGAELIQVNLAEADLSGANLLGASLLGTNVSGANLGGANLSGAYLTEADLSNAHLVDANLAHATLNRANLSSASLLGSTLRAASLQDANLTDAKGLVSAQLGGADVSGAKLPDHILKFEGLHYVEEISKTAAKVFISVLLGCVYTWLTIAATTDARLLTNTATSPLPVIQTEIPIVGFYWAAPFILVALYVYFHLYMQHLWKGLAELPAVFPDGKALDEKAHPWLLNSIVRAHVAKLRENRTLLSRLEVAVGIVLGWWLVPITLLGLWGRYLPRHDWAVTIFHMTLLAFCIVCVTWFQYLAKTTLRGRQQQPIRFKGNWRTFRPYMEAVTRGWKFVVLGLIILLLTFFVSDGAIKGRKIDRMVPGTEGVVFKSECLPSWQRAPTRLTDRLRYLGWNITGTRDLFRVVIPEILPCFGTRAFADLSDQEVSARPANWFLRDDKELPRIVRVARLSDMDLSYATALRAFLVRADLQHANLQGAILFEANLQKANLRAANLQGADLELANLQGARLSRANLQKANLDRADLRKARLYEADLRGANVIEASLDRTELQGANLEDTKGLTQEQINQACVDDKTKLPSGVTRPKPCRSDR